MIDLLFEVLILKSIGITILLTIILLVRAWVLKWSDANIAYSLWLMLPIYLLLPINFVEVTSTGGMMTFFLGAENLVVPFVDQGIFEGSHLALFCTSVWFAGVIVMLSLFIFRYQKLKQGLCYLSNDFLSDDFDRETKTQLQNHILVSSKVVDVPAVFGFIKSYLVLPTNFARLPTLSQQMILDHELYHLSRHDHRINFLRMFIKSLFWFNPLFSWADKICEADQEISCDLGVLQNSKSDNRLIYAKVLLESLTGSSQNKLLSQWKYQSLIKERVKMLKHISTKKWHSWVAVVFAASAIWLTSGVVMAETEENVKSLEATPITIVQPRYPRKAAMEMIEGWVKFRLDVRADGTPDNIKVIASEPEGVFEKTSMKAIKKWTFKPLEKIQKNLIYTMEYQLAPKGSEWVEVPKVYKNGKLVKQQGEVFVSKTGKLMKLKKKSTNNKNELTPNAIIDNDGNVKKNNDKK